MVLPIDARSYPCKLRSGAAVPFTGLAAASLVPAELRISLSDTAWLQGLAQAQGIYLITDERYGHHYIRSASGGLGILGR